MTMEAAEAVRRASELQAQASALVREIEAEIAAEVRSFEERARERRAAGLDAAARALELAEAALVQAKDMLPAHPWTGRTVFRLHYDGYVYERRPPRRLEGIVETVRSTTAFPAQQVHKPDAGSAIVRLAKKDGSQSVMFEPLTDLWELVDAEEKERADG